MRLFPANEDVYGSAVQHLARYVPSFGSVAKGLAKPETAGKLRLAGENKVGDLTQ
jgi:hypothetical protein